MKENCFLILSHSSYQDIWEMSLKSYKKYLPEDIDVFITSDDNLNQETKDMVKNLGYEVLYYPNKISWSDSLKQVINRYIINRYTSVIFSFDDLILLENISKLDYNFVLEQIKTNDYIILNNKHNNLFSDIFRFFRMRTSKIYNLSKNDSYIGSLVFSIWKTEFIYKIINLPDLENLNPWQYEVKIASVLKKDNNRKYAVLVKPLVLFANVIIKGKILRREMQKVNKENSIFYNGNRTFLSKKSEVKFTIYYTIFHLLKYLLPNRIFKLLRKSY